MEYFEIKNIFLPIFMSLTYAMTIFNILFIFLLPIPCWAQTNGRVAAGVTLMADDRLSPWISPSGDFALGFKQLENKDQFLFCIWFNKIPDQTVAWYPNTINPVVPRGSWIRLDAGSGQGLFDPQDKVLWSPQGIVGMAEGFMNDTGNFILKGTNGTWLWESFKVYADTILPGQELGFGSTLMSRKSEKNFSSNGRFYLSFRDDGNLVLTSNSSNSDAVDYFSTQTSDSQNPSNSGSRTVFNQSGSIYVLRNNSKIQQLSPVLSLRASEFYFRATLEFHGVFVIYSHPRNFSSTNSSWNPVWFAPRPICTALRFNGIGSGACGYNSICSQPYERPVCDCPIGYDWVDPDDKYGDCKPNYSGFCDINQKPDLLMLEQVNINWPGFSEYSFIVPTNATVCKQACLNDCLCAVSIFGGNKCWMKKLPLANGHRDPSLGTTVFIKSISGSWHAVPPDPAIPGGSKPKERGTLVILGAVLLGFSLLVLVLNATICFSFYRKRYIKIDQASPVETNLRCFTFKELTEATNDFTDELGSGSFGVVYKGELANTVVAVKKLNRLAQEKEFRAELNSIGKTNHKNLVHLVGFCDEGQNRLLVYEYMSNGCLASFIFNENKSSWSMRKQIALGIARGLVYLHEECSIQIIHCDIKPQNILLENSYNVRISDFGLAKLLEINQSKTSLTHVRGTRGYVAPEWFRNNQITAKVDVYSFGVLLLEIISCRKSVQGNQMGEENWVMPLTDMAWGCFEEKQLDSFVGNDVEALNDNVGLARYVMVGLWCIQENPSSRPTMRRVSQMLEGIVDVPIPPCPYPVSTTMV